MEPYPRPDRIDSDAAKEVGAFAWPVACWLLPVAGRADGVDCAAYKMMYRSGGESGGLGGCNGESAPGAEIRQADLVRRLSRLDGRRVVGHGRR